MHPDLMAGVGFCVEGARAMKFWRRTLFESLSPTASIQLSQDALNFSNPGKPFVRRLGRGYMSLRGCHLSLLQSPKPFLP